MEKIAESTRKAAEAAEGSERSKMRAGGVFCRAPMGAQEVCSAEPRGNPNSLEYRRCVLQSPEGGPGGVFCRAPKGGPNSLECRRCVLQSPEGTQSIAIGTLNLGHDSISSSFQARGGQ